MASAKTSLPPAATLGEFAIMAAANARRLLTDAEHLLTRGGWPTAYSLAVLAFEEAGKSWLSLSGLAVPGELKDDYPFGDLIGGHLNKLQVARTIAPWLGFIKGGADSVASFLEAVDGLEDLARKDNLAKQRGLYADVSDGVIWNPSRVKRDEARVMVAKVRDVLDSSAPLTDPGFITFMVAPPADAKSDLDTFVARFIDTLNESGPEAALAVVAGLRSGMEGIAEMLEQDARRISLARRQQRRTQVHKPSRAQRRQS